MLRLIFLIAVLLTMRSGSGLLAAPEGAQVTDDGTTVTLVFAGGHTLVWTKAGCDLDRWIDGAGHTLGRGLEYQANMPFGVNGQYRPAGRAITAWAAQGDTVTLDCSGTFGSTPAPGRYTLTGTARAFGVPYGGVAWQYANAYPLGNLSLGISNVQYDGSQLGAVWMNMDAVWEGMLQYNFLYPEVQAGQIDTGTTYTMLTRPEGVFAAYIPNLMDHTSTYHGFAVSQNTSRVQLSREFANPIEGQPFATPTFLMLWSPEAGGRALPQNWLDIKQGVHAEQWASLGLGTQHRPLPYERSGNSVGPDWNTAALRPCLHSLDPTCGADTGLYGQDMGQMFLHTGMFRSDDHQIGGPSLITHTDALDTPEVYLPNASDLPAEIPGITFPGQPPLQDPKGSGYTQGTLQGLRDFLAAIRIRGYRPGIWSREYYPGCIGYTANASEQWSRWDKTWTCSYLWKAHPDWGQQRSNGQLDPEPQAFPNFLHPGYAEWYKNVHRYWMDHGLVGFFKDTSEFPATNHSWFGGERRSQTPPTWDIFVDIYRHGGYIAPELPIIFDYTWLEKTGNPKYWRGNAWAYNDAGANWGYIARGWVDYPDERNRWDNHYGFLYHSIAGMHGCCVPESFVGNDRAEVRASNLYYTQMLQRFGIPDRIELIGPRPAQNTTVLDQAVSATATLLEVHNGWQVPFGALIQIGSERILLPYNRDAQSCTQDGAAINWHACSTYVAIRGYQGTTPAAHATGAVVTLLDDKAHWDWDDTYWVYGTGSNETWVRYGDGSVWQRGGSVAAALPSIATVAVATGGSGTTTISYTTSVPSASWVEYDTYGASEFQAQWREPTIGPMYQKRTGLDQSTLPLATSHSLTLQGLTPGALYHYRIVARGPAQAVTQDATFVAGGGAQATSTPIPPTATPGATATPVAGYGVYVSTQPNRSGAVPLQGQTVSGAVYVFALPEDFSGSPIQYALDGAHTRTEINPPYDFIGGTAGSALPWDTTTVSDGAHTITATFDGVGQTGSATFTVANTAPPPTPTRTATAVPPSSTSLPTSTRTPTPTTVPSSTPTPVPTATATRTPTPTVGCILVHVDPVSAAPHPCPP